MSELLALFHERDREAANSHKWTVPTGGDGTIIQCADCEMMLATDELREWPAWECPACKGKP